MDLTLFKVLNKCLIAALFYINEWDSIYKFYIFSLMINISNVWVLIRKDKIEFDYLALIISIFKLNTEFNDRKYMRASSKYFMISWKLFKNKTHKLSSYTTLYIFR